MNPVPAETGAVNAREKSDAAPGGWAYGFIEITIRIRYLFHR